MIVERDPNAVGKVLWTDADQQFEQFGASDLEKVASSIGTSHPVDASGMLHLLNPVVPKPLAELALSDAQKNYLLSELAQTKKQIEKIQDPQRRADAFEMLEKSQNKSVLGIPLKDRTVLYNPTPQQQFLDVFHDAWRTLYGLIFGYASPKYIAGPVGIVHMVHQSWSVGPKEALFWMALISLNLGILNLLPLPILDGGHIVFSLIELFTKRPLRARTMERLVIPFVGLMIAFFVYVTYHDLARLLSSLF